MTDTKRATEVQAQRRRRQDTGPNAGLKLYVPEALKEPGYEYRWINDDGRRIHAKTVLDDWDIVKDPKITGEGQDTKRVGKMEGGAPLNAYLCRKPDPLYKEDKAKEIRVIAEREDAMRRGAPPSPQGLSGPTTYIPDRMDGFSSDRPGENRIGGTYKP